MCNYFIVIIIICWNLVQPFQEILLLFYVYTDYRAELFVPLPDGPGHMKLSIRQEIFGIGIQKL